MSRALVLLLACAACKVGEDGPDAFDPRAPRIAATIEPNTIAPGGTFVLNVTVDNFMFDSISGQPNQDGHGHYHVYLDDMPNYLASDVALQRNVTIGSDVELGDHTVKVALANNDHSDYAPATFTLLFLECLED